MTCMHTRRSSPSVWNSSLLSAAGARPAVFFLRRMSATQFLSLMGSVSSPPCKLSRLDATMAETASRLPVCLCCLVLIFLLIAPHQSPSNSSSQPTQSVVRLRLVLALSATPFLLLFSAPPPPPTHFYTPSISPPPPVVSQSHFVSESLALDCAASPWDVSAISRSLISQSGSWQGSAARRGVRAHSPTSINETSHAPAASVTRPLQRGAFSWRGPSATRPLGSGPTAQRLSLTAAGRQRESHTFNHQGGGAKGIKRCESAQTFVAVR